MSIIPESDHAEMPGYAPGHWDYPRRCADVESALVAARERAGEWDKDTDPHGWWHERPDWIALHNEVLRLRGELERAKLTANLPLILAALEEAASDRFARSASARTYDDIAGQREHSERGHEYLATAENLRRPVTDQSAPKGEGE